MARRYGGEFSPDAQPQAGPVNREPVRAGARVNLLFLLPLPLAVRAFFLDAVGLATTLAALAVLLLAAWLTRDGVRAHQAYDARKVARRPAMPRKLMASLLTGGGLALAVSVEAQGALEPALYAIIGALLHFFAFGPDPMSDKGMDGVDTFQQDRVARAVDEAEKHLARMKTAIEGTKDRSLLARVEHFTAIVQNMARTVEEDPRDLTAARRYLGVYLLGARDAAEKYADIHRRGDSQAARNQFESLLDDLETNFLTRTEGFLANDKTDLGVEIDVLKERLALENK